MKLTEAKSLLSKINEDLKRIGENEDEFELENFDADERFEHQILRDIASKADEISSLFEYMNKPVVAEGVLQKNQEGRYKIAGTEYYFTSGSPIEIWDQEEQTYWKTRIEHSGNDYYAVYFNELTLEGVKARVRAR